METNGVPFPADMLRDDILSSMFPTSLKKRREVVKKGVWQNVVKFIKSDSRVVVLQRNIGGGRVAETWEWGSPIGSPEPAAKADGPLKKVTIR